MKFLALALSLLMLSSPAVFAAKKPTKAGHHKVHKAKGAKGAKAKKAKKKKAHKGPKLDESGKKMKMSPPAMRSHAPDPELPKQEGAPLPAPETPAE